MPRGRYRLFTGVLDSRLAKDAVQHEIDHLDGMLFVDRVVSRRTDLFKRKVYQKGGSAKTP
jgi:peptide deformylase